MIINKSHDLTPIEKESICRFLFEVFSPDEIMDDTQQEVCLIDIAKAYTNTFESLFASGKLWVERNENGFSAVGQLSKDTCGTLATWKIIKET